MIAFAYSMVVPGRPRTIAKCVAAAVVAVGAAAALYLATFGPFDIAMGIALPVALVVNGFRIFTPSEVFPVSYRGGKKAHLDVGGERGEAIQRAVQDQLGLSVIEMKPVGSRWVGWVDAIATAGRLAIPTRCCSGSSTR